EEQEYTRVRAALVKAITTGPAPAHPRQATPPPEGDDYAPFRERYRDLQQSMQAETGRLRGRLRDMLASGSPGQARLAEVDAVKEMALTPREHALPGAVPGLLGQHFQRLNAASRMRRFQQDMQHVLLAELDVRFQPVEGLLAALRTR